MWKGAFMTVELEMITKHLIKSKMPKMADKTICGICGKEVYYASKIKDVLSSCFTNYNMFSYTSNYICINCITCMSGKALNGKALRNFNLLITNKEIKIIKYSYLYNLIKNTPNEDFIIQISFLRRKHCFTFYEVNKANTNIISIATDKGRFYIDRKEFIFYFKIIYSLYSFGFKKEEIADNSYTDLNRIEKFGMLEFFKLNEEVEIIRKTMLCTFILLSITKDK